jgi:hypothetical protein
MQARKSSRDLATEDPLKREPRRFDDDDIKPETGSRGRHLSSDKTPTNDDKTLARAQKGTQPRCIV